MSVTLTNKFKKIPPDAIPYAAASIFYRFLDTARDNEPVFLAMSTLAFEAKCSLSTAKRMVHLLVKMKVLVPVGQAGGRGHAQWFNIDFTPFETQKKPERKPREKIVAASNGVLAPVDERAAFIASRTAFYMEQGYKAFHANIKAGVDYDDRKLVKR